MTAIKCLRGPSERAAVYVNGARARGEGAALPNGAEISVCAEGLTRLVTFRVLRDLGKANMAWALDAVQCRPSVLSPREALEEAEHAERHGEGEVLLRPAAPPLSASGELLRRRGPVAERPEALRPGAASRGTPTSAVAV
ncbi:unnamed protein product [Prorocentrum cordatum]|uniref:Inositol-pentakisphosphate 2-kinase n=1 Tax=Prorocentrum cordatum TaxID=2364126 RepID=A0ABN9VPL5_9DINO|nr:unnamed protein product [Polarella glacialis]